MEVTFYHGSVDSAEEWDVRPQYIPIKDSELTISAYGLPRRAVIVLSVAEDSSKSHKDHVTYYFRSMDDLYQFEDAIRTAVQEMSDKAGVGPRPPKPSQPKAQGKAVTTHAK